MVAGIEEKMRELLDADPTTFDELTDQAESAPSARERTPAGARRPRSRLALASGILGIIALVLMFATPISYVVIASIAELIGEVATYVLLGLNLLIVGGGGGIALVMGIAALLRLSRSRSRKRGYGWAITSLCTAPVPALAGLLVLLSVGFPLAIEFTTADGGNSPPVYTASAPPPLSASPYYPSGPVEPYSAAPYPPPASGPSVTPSPYGANAPTPWIEPPPLPSVQPFAAPSVPPSSPPAPPSETPSKVAPGETPSKETPPVETLPAETPAAGPEAPSDTP